MLFVDLIVSEDREKVPPYVYRGELYTRTYGY